MNRHHAPLLTESEAATVLGLKDKRALARLRRKGDGSAPPSIAVGRFAKYHPNDVYSFMAKNRAAGGGNA